MLEVEHLTVTYGPIQALKDVSLSVGEHEIVALVGANGAGKTTLLNTICGLVRPHEGRVLLEGRSISSLKPAAVVGRGVVQVPEGRQVFPGMSVLENLEMGAFLRPASEARKDLEQVFSLFSRLHERQSQLAGLLSGGEQQMLALGRALMAKPRLLLLDEPSMGLAPMVIVDIFRMLRRFSTDFGITILLVEQNARAALGLASRAYVLANGSVRLHGPCADLLADSAIQEAFLGRTRQ